MAPRADLRRSVAHWLDTVTTRRAILLAGWLLFVIYAYPGYMSTDSVDQLEQARSGQFHDWYPPLMALLWRYTDKLIAGPFPMLVLQSVTFLLGLDAILRQVLRPRVAALAACAVLVFPAVLSPMAVIWKDSQMAGFFLAGLACLLSPRRGIKLAGCGLLFLATAQRYNAAAGTFPIVMGLFVWRAELARWRRYALAAAVFVAITAGSFAVNRALTDHKMYAWHGSVALLDIAGTIRYAPPIDDAEVRSLLGDMPVVPKADLQARIRKAYWAREWWGLVAANARGDNHVFSIPANAAEREAVASAWRAVVTAYPTAYLAHRLRVFRELLGFSYTKVGAVWDGFTENEAQADRLGHRATHSQLQSAWLELIPALEDSIIFKPWAYFVVALVLLPLCRRNRLAFVVLASGLGNELSLVLVAPSSDYRYSHWLIVCTLTAVILVFATRWREGTKRDPGVT